MLLSLNRSADCQVFHSFMNGQLKAVYLELTDTIIETMKAELR